MAALGWDNRHKAWEGLRATLHALRDRPTVDENDPRVDAEEGLTRAEGEA